FNSFLIIIFSFICCTGFSQSLNVNTAFGNNGVVTANGGNDAIMRNEVFATQPDGKFLFGTPGLLRTFPDCTIDSSLGTKGLANMREVNSNVNSIAVQADGKIIVSTIYNNNGYYGINCIRFSNDG